MKLIDKLLDCDVHSVIDDVCSFSATLGHMVHHDVCDMMSCVPKNNFGRRVYKLKFFFHVFHNKQESRHSTDGTSPSPEITSKSQDDLKDSKKSSTSSGGSKLGDRAKKKAWYNVIYPSYKSRSEDYKKLFNVPDDERLVVGESDEISKSKIERIMCDKIQLICVCVLVQPRCVFL